MHRLRSFLAEGFRRRHQCKTRRFGLDTERRGEREREREREEKETRDLRRDRTRNNKDGGHKEGEREVERGNEGERQSQCQSPQFTMCGSWLLALRTRGRATGPFGPFGPKAPNKSEKSQTRVRTLPRRAPMCGVILAALTPTQRDLA